MKYFIITIIFLLLFTELKAQLDSINLSTGIELQGGIGNFGDPTLNHGFTLTTNGAIGVSNKSNTFGYDAFSVNARWVPGTNRIGKRIAIQFGSANWFTPALSTVYLDTILEVTEKALESKSVNAIMAGLVFNIGALRNSNDYYIKIRNSESNISLFDSLSLELVKARNLGPLGEIKANQILKQIADLNWKKVIRPTFRRPTLTIGSTFRLGTLGTESDIEALDIFMSGAAGKGIVDFAASLHYLKPIDNDLIAKDAFTGNIGMFIDLDDSPPINIMGIIFGIGNYNYVEKIRKIKDNQGNEVTLSDTPNSTRFDVTISFSNIFGKSNTSPFSNSIAFRYSKLWHSSTDDEGQFVVIFTNKFVSSRKDK